MKQHAHLVITQLKKVGGVLWRTALPLTAVNVTAPGDQLLRDTAAPAAVTLRATGRSLYTVKSSNVLTQLPSSGVLEILSLLLLTHSSVKYGW